MSNRSITRAGLLAFLLAAPLQAQSVRPVLDLSKSRQIASHCVEMAASLDAAIAISVYDHQGTLVLFLRMDDVAIGFANAAMWKGQSAALYRTSTLETADWNAPGAPSLATVEGGLPIFDDQGVALGGVGVSGSSSEFDASCARSAIRAAGLTHTR